MITFTERERAELVQKIQVYFADEHEHALGQFDAEFVLRFFAEEVGVFFYNRGLLDAQAALVSQLDTIQDAIYQLEKPTPFDRKTE